MPVIYNAGSRFAFSTDFVIECPAIGNYPGYKGDAKWPEWYSTPFLKHIIGTLRPLGAYGSAGRYLMVKKDASMHSLSDMVASLKMNHKLWLNNTGSEFIALTEAHPNSLFLSGETGCWENIPNPGDCGEFRILKDPVNDIKFYSAIKSVLEITGNGCRSVGLADGEFRERFEYLLAFYGDNPKIMGRLVYRYWEMLNISDYMSLF